MIDLYVAHLAEVAEMHPTVFVRKFRAKYRIPPIQYRIKTRLNEAARTGWLEPTRSMTSIADERGFQNRAYFYRAFQRYLGTTPERYLRFRNEEALFIPK